MKLLYRIVPVILIPIIIFAVTYHLTFTYVFSNTILESTLLEAKGIGKLTASELENPVYFLNVEEISSIINNVKKTNKITSVIVLDSKGNVITDGTNQNPDVGKIPDDLFTLDAISSDAPVHIINEDVLRLGCPILITERVGTLVIDFSLEEYQTVIRDSQDIIITITLVVAVIAATVAFRFSNEISEQIKKIQKYSHKIADGDASPEIENLDIDELKNLGKDLKIMEKKLETTKNEIIKSERLSSIGELSSRLAHDLRNPLSVIKNSIYVLEHHMEDVKDDMLKKYFEVLKEETERINHQINEVLGFIKTRELQISSINSSELLEKSIPEILPKNIEISHSDNTIKINGDKELLLIVFRNLIQNAIQAIGHKNGKISIDCSEDEDWSIVKIIDDGPGIPEKIMNDIFEPLYTTKQEGTGLGLVTCKTVVEQHGGIIEVTNNPDKGVTFTVKIPKRHELE